ncbi:DUF4956 domain-containing protein [Vagococcus luciliae]|uniref:DUF4956 domain-containing protein n=1 Tax=Vagococcus luciliae TaxID=2920380 RepID=A0ABY5NYL7_9ENTE|nr:DUF4956 domain-containing protein [Vagococcus luciliae]UUV98744.1 hypothetical protein G314FT_08980 [Vagococcus luciliae]
MLASIFPDGSSTIELTQLLLCTLTSIGLGIVVSYIHTVNNIYTKNFIVTLAILPVLVQSVIMLVNGNLGTGMAVVGAFSLVRFRSVAGGSREITSIFWSMGIGLATGMGFIVYAIIFSLFVTIILMGLYLSPFGSKQKLTERELKITISEDLDYPDLFQDIFDSYVTNQQLDSVRTTTMGSLYELRYHLILKEGTNEKELLDAIRVRNGNLPVVLGRCKTHNDTL